LFKGKSGRLILNERKHLISRSYAFEDGEAWCIPRLADSGGKKLVVAWIAPDDCRLFCAQGRLCGSHVLTDGKTELPGKPSKLRFACARKRLTTKSFDP
jgi:hypothetical protein